MAVTDNPATAGDAPAASPIEQHASPVDDTRKTSGKATAALVLGIIGALAFLIPIAAWILGGIAVGFGFAARSEIKARGLGGLGRANAGLVLGFIAIGIGTAIFVVNVILAT